jgi:phosphoribosylamine--glycine ligase
VNVLILGNGGREHALAQKISQSKILNKLYVMPGNPGTSLIADNIDINPMNQDEVLCFCKEQYIDLVIPGSEVYLERGITDFLNSAGIDVFGPTKKAAQIETSKEFAKNLMDKYHIPTANYQVFDDYDRAINYINNQEIPIVIKYDGLAGGKGVVVADTKQKAIDCLQDMLVSKKYGTAKVIIEEYLQGPEFSLMCFVNGDMIIPMPICQDHKRLLDNDMGPNTGGMGIYSPVPIINDEVVNWSFKNIMIKVVDALNKEGIVYTGFIYGGLMNTKEGPKVIEFNARLGDPEAEVIMPKLESDLLEIILSLKNKKKTKPIWNKDYILGVVMASKGYPDFYQKGYVINNLELIDNYYHMGTKVEDQKLLTNGGRVLFVYGRGETLQKAKEEAYKNVKKIACENLIFRGDIGYKSINKED